MLLVEVDYFLMALLGFFTGLGTTFGAELARTLFSKVNRLVEKHGNKVKH
jgi:hypothetical protein